MCLDTFLLDLGLLFRVFEKEGFFVSRRFDEFFSSVCNKKKTR